MQSFAQEIEIFDVPIQPASYKYLDKVAEDTTEVSPAEPVKIFQQRTAIFNLQDSEFYNDEYYFLSFYIAKAIVQKYPGWIVSDLYLFGKSSR